MSHLSEKRNLKITKLWCIRNNLKSLLKAMNLMFNGHLDVMPSTLPFTYFHHNNQIFHLPFQMCIFDHSTKAS